MTYSWVPKVVIATTHASDQRPQIWAIASIPDSTGICRSISTTSGRSFSKAVTPSLPFTASPHRTTPVWSAKNER
jgi:hypothetical protein